MENVKLFTLCEDNSCCCLSPRRTAVLISITSIFACLLDVLSNEFNEENCDEARFHLSNLRCLLITLFELASVLLFLGSIVECAILLQMYLWYMLAYVVVSFVLAILEFCFRIKDEGSRGFVTFVPEVIFLFVIFRCLPLVDFYRRRLEDIEQSH